MRLLKPFWGVTQFSWLSPMYARGIHATILLFIFLLLICPFITGVGGCLSQQPRRMEGKLFFLLHMRKDQIVHLSKESVTHSWHGLY